jgi:hypothetical protein
MTPGHDFVNGFKIVNSSVRDIYRPEIALKDRTEKLQRIDQENKELIKQGKKPSSVTSSVVLWH